MRPRAEPAVTEATVSPSAQLREARESAMRILVGREHSTAELARKLSARGHDRGIVEQVVATLEERALVSDDRFVESFARVRTERGQGPIRIRAELRQRGIDESLIDAAVTQPAEFWLTQMERARRKRFGDAKPSARAGWSQQARFLAQRGFPADLIYRALGGES